MTRDTAEQTAFSVLAGLLLLIAVSPLSSTAALCGAAAVVACAAWQGRPLAAACAAGICGWAAACFGLHPLPAVLWPAIVLADVSFSLLLVWFCKERRLFPRLTLLLLCLAARQEVLYLTVRILMPLLHCSGGGASPLPLLLGNLAVLLRRRKPPSRVTG